LPVQWAQHTTPDATNRPRNRIDKDIRPHVAHVENDWDPVAFAILHTGQTELNRWKRGKNDIWSDAFRCGNSKLPCYLDVIPEPANGNVARIPASSQCPQLQARANLNRGVLAKMMPLAEMIERRSPPNDIMTAASKVTRKLARPVKAIVY